MGFSVTALIPLRIAVTAMTRANCRYIWPVMPGRKAAGRKDRNEHKSDADDRSEEFIHRGDGGVLRRLAAFNMLGRALDHDNGVVHHNAHGQHDGEAA